MIPTENYRKYIGKDLKVYVVKVDKTTDESNSYLKNRSNFLKRLFEREIVEVYDGTVEIM